MTMDALAHAPKWWARRLGVLALSLLLGGCLFAPSAKELQEAATDVSSRTIGKASKALEEADVRAEARIRQAAERYEADVRSASESLAAVARSANDLVAVAREGPASLTQAVTAQESVQATIKNVSGLAESVDRAVGLAKDNATAFRTTLADLQADLVKDDGVLARQRAALFEDLRREREAIVAALHQERAAVLTQLDTMSGKLLDQASRMVTNLAEVEAPKLIDRASQRAHELAGTALWMGILLFLVIVGLPFASGVLVGRLWRTRPGG
jgi:hypothetical protein